jgi:hypothetical protein
LANEVAAAHVTPEENEEDMLAALKTYREERDAKLRHMLDAGFLIWSKRPPAQRLAYYREHTLASEMPLLFDDEYLPRLQEGSYPPPQSPIWALLLQLPDFVFEKLRGDFRRLVRAEERRAFGR